jgi:hypothetical protein
MKVVKVHKNWDLYKRGYRVAFRFQSHFLPKQFDTIIGWLNENRGKKAEWSWDDENSKFQWTIAKGRAQDWRKPTPVFVALKEEADASIVLLASGANFG